MDADAPLLEITESPLPSGTLQIALTGDLDITTAPALQQRLRHAFDSHPGTSVELDLSALEFCDLAGLRTLQAAEHAAAAAHCPVRITAAAPCLDILLQYSQTPELLGYPAAKT